MSELSYQTLLDLLDKGRLPVVTFGSGGVRHAHYSVEDWSPIITGERDEREDLIAQAIYYTGMQAPK